MEAFTAPELRLLGRLDSGDDFAERPVGTCRCYQAGAVPFDGDFDALFRAYRLWQPKIPSKHAGCGRIGRGAMGKSQLVDLGCGGNAPSLGTWNPLVKDPRG